MNHLVCYGDWKFEESKQLLITSAKHYGIDIVHDFGEKELKETSFYTENKKILSAEKGGGYWLWKPFFIHKIIHQLSEGDVLVYLDCGAEVKKSLEPLMDLCKKEDIVLFKAHGHKNRQWVKKDIFVAMDCDEEKYWNRDMLSAGYQIYKVTERAKKFVDEWLYFSTKDALITDEKNTLGFDNHPEFLANRHDQAILSVLAAKYNIDLHRDPSQNGAFYVDKSDGYPTIINLHRSRKLPMKTMLIEKYLGPIYLFLFKK